MATSQLTPKPLSNSLVPLHISGNTTEQQNKMLQDFLGEAMQEAYRTAIEQLDRNSAKSVLETGQGLKAEVVDARWSKSSIATR